MAGLFGMLGGMGSRLGNMLGSAAYNFGANQARQRYAPLVAAADQQVAARQARQDAYNSPTAAFLRQRDARQQNQTVYGSDYGGRFSGMGADDFGGFNSDGSATGWIGSQLSRMRMMERSSDPLGGRQYGGVRSTDDPNVGPMIGGSQAVYNPETGRSSYVTGDMSGPAPVVQFGRQDPKQLAGVIERRRGRLESLLAQRGAEIPQGGANYDGRPSSSQLLGALRGIRSGLTPMAESNRGGQQGEQSRFAQNLVASELASAVGEIPNTRAGYAAAGDSGAEWLAQQVLSGELSEEQGFQQSQLQDKKSHGAMGMESKLRNLLAAKKKRDADAAYLRGLGIGIGEVNQGGAVGGGFYY